MSAQTSAIDTRLRRLRLGYMAQAVEVRIPTKRATQSEGRGPPDPGEEGHVFRGMRATDRSEATLGGR